MSMARRSALINVMVKAAEKASRALVRDFGEVENLQISRKGPSDFVSAADLKSEDTLREELSHARPKFGFLLEENGEIKGEDPDKRWIIDPLDGTTNFLHGIPQWSISIAAEDKGRIVAGVVFNPITHELFWAERGLGAYLNSKRLQCSARGKLEDCIIGTGTPARGVPQDEFDHSVQQIMAVMPHTAGMRRLGSAALDLCYVAAGRMDGFFERRLSPWDLAAGMLIVQEAGGTATDIGNGQNTIYNDDVIAANPKIYKELRDLIKKSATEHVKEQAAS